MTLKTKPLVHSGRFKKILSLKWWTFRALFFTWDFECCRIQVRSFLQAPLIFEQHLKNPFLKMKTLILNHSSKNVWNELEHLNHHNFLLFFQTDTGTTFNLKDEGEFFRFLTEKSNCLGYNKPTKKMTITIKPQWLSRLEEPLKDYDLKQERFFSSQLRKLERNI